MLKLKYYTLNKDEKKKLKEKFYNTEIGKSLKTRLNRLFILGISGLLFSLYLFIFHSNYWDIYTGVLLIIASLVFIIGSFKIRINKLNEFLVKDKK